MYYTEYIFIDILETIRIGYVSLPVYNTHFNFDMMLFITFYDL